jgi:hypothetical protein
MTTVLIIFIYFICVWFNVGAMNGYFKKQYPSSSRDTFDRDIVFYTFYSLLGTIAWLFTTFATGFYKHGVSWKR